jgi:hypothetical protein
VHEPRRKIPTVGFGITVLCRILLNIYTLDTEACKAATHIYYSSHKGPTLSVLNTMMFNINS